MSPSQRIINNVDDKCDYLNGTTIILKTFLTRSPLFTYGKNVSMYTLLRLCMFILYVARAWDDSGRLPVKCVAYDGRQHIRKTHHSGFAPISADAH